MAVILQAPANLIETITVLPDPLIGDNYAPEEIISLITAMSGKNRTYINKLSTYKILMNFELDLLKAYELFAFYSEYIGKEIQMIDHHGSIWRGHITSNPLELRTSGSGRLNSCDYEYKNTTIEFRMRKI